MWSVVEPTWLPSPSQERQSLRKWEPGRSGRMKAVCKGRVKKLWVAITSRWPTKSEWNSSLFVFQKIISVELFTQGIYCYLEMMAHNWWQITPFGSKDVKAVVMVRVQTQVFKFALDVSEYFASLIGHHNLADFPRLLSSTFATSIFLAFWNWNQENLPREKKLENHHGMNIFRLGRFSLKEKNIILGYQCLPTQNPLTLHRCGFRPEQSKWRWLMHFYSIQNVRSAACH